jgi:muramoyltetrapeptide carboxypeptidase
MFEGIIMASDGGLPVSARTAAGLLKFRPLRPGGRVALVAPASAFDRDQFTAGVAELQRIGLQPVYDDVIFDRQPFTAGSAESRAQSLQRAFDRMDADAVMAVRGGYGSMHLLPLLDPERLRRSRTAFVGYSDVTALHSYLAATVGLASVHGPMVEGRFAKGPAAYDPVTFWQSLGPEPIGELAPAGLEVVVPGDAAGPLVGGTLTQLLASFETPFVFRPPERHVLFIDEVGERPYRLHRMFTQLQMSGRLASAAAVVVGQLPECDEPGGAMTARDVVYGFFAGFPGPVLFGFPSGHTTTPSLSVPFGVLARVVAQGTPTVVIEEAAAAD